MHRAKVGTVVRERYELRRLIGEGGFGTVWEAVELTSSRRVALKTLKTFNKEALRRFDVECAALRRLDHPHCVRIIDSGREEAGPFVVTEFIEGLTLREWVRDVPPADERVEVARQIATALAHAHRCGVLHRDLKPDNILVTTTPAGPAAKVVDGEAPFDGPTNLETAMQHLLETAPRLGGAAPPRVVELVGKMLSKDPEARPTMAVVVQRLLGRSRAEIEPTKGKSRSVVLAMVAVGIGALAVGAFFVTSGPDPPDEQVPQFREHVLQEALKSSEPVRNVADAGADAARAVDLPTMQLPPELPVGERRSAGCGKEPLTKTFYLRKEGQASHEIHIRVPENYDPDVSAPLLVMFHDTLQPAAQLLDLFPLIEPALERGFIVLSIADDIRNDTWLDEGDYDEAVDSVEWVQDRLCIDTQRVFLFGHGNGGWGATNVACRIPVRATATTAHRIWVDRDLCDAVRPNPKLTVSMMEDPFSPAGGGRGCFVETITKSVDDHEDRHRARHRCSRRTALVYEDRGGSCWRAHCEVPLEWCRADGARSWAAMPMRDAAMQIGQIVCGGSQQRPSEFDFGGRIWTFFDEHDVKD